MVVRMKITLEQEDFSKLLKLALSELRTPEGQLLFILRKELNLHFQALQEDDLLQRQNDSFGKEVSNGE
jgi:hypothetical protein